MKINVITVTYNQLEGLKKQYKSILSQSKYVKEWIVYDDRSKDGTIDWIGKQTPCFPVKIIEGIKREKPLVVANMNECMKATDGGVFILSFADSYYKEDALKNLSETYIPNSFGSAARIDVNEKGQPLQGYFLNNVDKSEDDVRNMMSTKRGWESFAGNGMIATKSIMEGIGYIDETYGGYGVDDYDTAMRTMMNGALLYLYLNVKIYHTSHFVKNTTPDNIKRYMTKLEGTGYSL